jgi:polar amino acid transport system substrate-binding protein
MREGAPVTSHGLAARAPARRLNAVLVASALAAVVGSPPPATAAPPPLRVGVSHAPPFAILHDDGSWSGIAVDLWNEVAADLQRPFTFESRDLTGSLDGLRDGSLDVVAGPTTLTPEHANVADFTTPYFATALAVAARPPGSLDLGRLLTIVFSPRLLHVLLTMASAALMLGVVVWLLERRRNSDHFEKHPARGVWSAVWWASATLTTVGYGDKTPRSVPGRLVAILGMIVGILLASILTATFASEMTLTRMRGVVGSPDDLRNVAVGAVAGSAGQSWLAAHGVRSRVYPDVASALDALGRGDVDAVVDLDAVLRYEAHERLRGDLKVQQVALESEFLAFALPRGSDLRGSLDHAILRTVHADPWARLLRSYLGRP